MTGFRYIKDVSGFHLLDGLLILFTIIFIHLLIVSVIFCYLALFVNGRVGKRFHWHLFELLALFFLWQQMIRVIYFFMNILIELYIIIIHYTVIVFSLQALEKSKYEQSLESVRHFIAIAEKELELYYRHIALYGDPSNRNPISILDSPTKDTRESRKLKMLERKNHDLIPTCFSSGISDTKADSIDEELSEIEDDLKGEDRSEEHTSELQSLV